MEKTLEYKVPEYRITGERLIYLLRRALRDYEESITLPFVAQAERWVLTRTKIHGSRPCSRLWFLAPLAEVSEVPGGRVIAAVNSRCYRATHNYHPSLHDLKNICNLIKR